MACCVLWLICPCRRRSTVPMCCCCWVRMWSSSWERGLRHWGRFSGVNLALEVLHYFDHWIGLRENLQESPIINGKIYGFRLRFSLKPIHWFENSQLHMGVLILATGHWPSRCGCARLKHVMRRNGARPCRCQHLGGFEAWDLADIFCLGISRNWIENLQESTGKPAVAQNFLLQVSMGGRRLPADDGSGRVLGPWQRRGMQDRRYDSFESRFSTVRSSSFGLRDLIIKPAFLICSKVSKVIFSPSWSRERETSGLPSTFTSWWQTSEANNPFLSVFQLPSLLAEAHST